MHKIIIDTNFAMIPSQFKVDIFSEIDRICSFEHKVFVLDKTLEELNKIIIGQKGKNKRNANLALQILKAKAVSVIGTEKDLVVDDLIVDIIKKEDFVATQDKELKKRVKAKGAGIITMRQEKYLIIE
jgi:hypothetical protein